MASGRQSKTDLLVRVRYQNPLPPPPFPPRLLHIETTPHRYATYDFLTPLNNERELPMILDGELGLPLELGKIREGEYGDGEYWLGNRSGIAPKGPPPPADDEDLFLLGDAVTSSLAPGLLPSSLAGATVGERKKVDVSWLRRTEYLSSEAGNKVTGGTGGLGTKQPAAKPVIELTRDTRCNAIMSTFAAASTPLPTLRHPTKPHLHAEESWSLLPDAKLWANDLSLVKFGEDPSEGRGLAHGGPDPRLPRAMFRPVVIPGEENRIGYYLPRDKETAEAYEARRRAGPEGASAEEESFEFKYVRDYEISASRKLQKEYVLCFDNGLFQTDDAPSDERPAKRAKGAYYATLSEAQTLRKRRPRRNEDPTHFPAEVVAEGIEFWDGISIKVAGLDVLPEEDRQDREGLENEVAVPGKSRRLD